MNNITTITVRATKKHGLVQVGDTLSGVVDKFGKVTLEGLPIWTAHPILFLEDGKVPTWEGHGKVYRMGNWDRFEIV
jgi:hypothetical protein